MADAKVNGVSLHYERQGTGPSVILVHGSWSDAGNWASVIPLLAQNCTVVAYDRRGHSRSERPNTQGSVHEDVADLAMLIEALGLAPVFVCGNSYGGLITLQLAAGRPHLVRGIAVHEPPGVPLLLDDPATQPLVESYAERLGPVRRFLDSGRYEAAAELFVDTIAFTPGTWPQLPPEVRDTFVRNGPTFLDELRDPDALNLDLPELRTYDKPVLLTGSDDSPELFPPILDRLARQLPQAERHVYSGGGHAPHLTQPQEYARVVLPRVLGPVLR